MNSLPCVGGPFHGRAFMAHSDAHVFRIPVPERVLPVDFAEYISPKAKDTLIVLYRPHRVRLTWHNARFECVCLVYDPLGEAEANTGALAMFLSAMLCLRAEDKSRERGL